MVNDGYYGYINYNEMEVPFHGCEIINEGWVGVVVIFTVITNIL